MATPFLIETPTNFATITGSTNIPITVPTTAGIGTPVTIGSLALPLSSKNDVVFIEGTIPLVFTTLAALTAAGSLDVVLEVFRSNTSTAPIFRSRQTIINGLTLATVGTTIYDILPFQFVDDPVIPLCGGETDYFFRAYVVTTGITVAAASLTVNSTAQGLFYNITAEEESIAGALGDPVIPDVIVP
ncbi:hypothetical protein [Clostridium folliculivorans]|uniref:Uncharacterized protein n=1 Tax=Clostridium folliculivorans TaxID=2886038 RepID=A0A9W6D991_9CLOT|nr:hypothetical protein [Clostridium folliculivorans]GKU23522.1 hypothetical protein CFOLD11_03480 [Clostridium folliculivorans]GKU29638.1 hypothetical protein CFB3_17450 [Clostridium folliculivorans]